MPFHQKSIDAAKAFLLEAIENLSKKGVNIREIKKQTQATEDKISTLDKKYEELLETRENLMILYKLEKEKRLEANQNGDNIREREED